MSDYDIIFPSSGSRLLAPFLGGPALGLALYRQAVAGLRMARGGLMECISWKAVEFTQQHGDSTMGFVGMSRNFTNNMGIKHRFSQF